MKIIPLICVLSMIVALPGAALAQAGFVRDEGALASFDHISDDGCVHTVGEIAILEPARGAENPAGLYITGSQEDVCEGTGNGFASFTEGHFPVIGLLYARYAGTVVAPSYSGGADITFEIDLTWLGRGRISRERTDTGVSASRDAKLRGFVRADGVKMQVSSARLIQQTRRPGSN